MHPKPEPQLPLLQGHRPDSVIAWRGGSALRTAAFLADAQALAADLPQAASLVNLCQDRYHFAVGLAAAMLRGQSSLLPPNAMPATIAGLVGAGVGCALVDHGAAAPIDALPVVAVRHDPALPAGQAVPVIAPELEAVRLLTSGSTGAPQPHGKRWATLVGNIRAEVARLAEVLGRPSLEGVAIVATVPAQHSYGLESSVMLALLGGAAFDAGRPFYPADVAAALRAVPRPRVLVTTPFHLKTVLRSGVELPPVDLVVSATAPLGPQDAAEAERRFEGTLIEIYGCTEAGQVATRRTTQGEVWTTFGELRLRARSGNASGADAGAAANGHSGEAGHEVGGGHLPEPTALSDVLELVDERRFRLLGRSNDVIHVAGKRSSLAHLNFHLNRIAGIEDGAFWMPDDVPGEVTRPVAFVVAPTRSAAQIVDGLRGQLEPAFLPRRVVHVAALPRESTGKLVAGVLRQFALAHLDERPARSVWIGAAYPAFDGHFPGQPVLPGVVLLAHVMRAVRQDPAAAAVVGPTPRIEQAKFLAPVVPNTRLGIDLRAQAPAVAFELHGFGADGEATPVARGRVLA
jgi:acyl-CoA synthetase (AMP-forming)/AMP-acid ligase II